MILVMRLLDMAGLRMPVLPVAIDWNANIQLPVGLFGVGLEGAAACFDDGPVAVEAAAQAESHVLEGVGYALAEMRMASVSKVTQMACHSPGSACLAMLAYSFASKPASRRMVSGVSGRCGSASRLSPVCVLRASR